MQRGLKRSQRASSRELRGKVPGSEPTSAPLTRPSGTPARPPALVAETPPAITQFGSGKNGLHLRAPRAFASRLEPPPIEKRIVGQSESAVPQAETLAEALPALSETEPWALPLSQRFARFLSSLSSASGGVWPVLCCMPCCSNKVMIICSSSSEISHWTVSLARVFVFLLA